MNVLQCHNEMSGLNAASTAAAAISAPVTPSETCFPSSVKTPLKFQGTSTPPGETKQGVTNLEEKLRELCCFGDLKSVREILRNPGVNVNSQNKVNGWTALHWASKRGYLDIVQHLLQSGADPNILNSSSQLALNLATDPKIFNLLSSQTSVNSASWSQVSSEETSISGSKSVKSETSFAKFVPNVNSGGLPAKIQGSEFKVMGTSLNDDFTYPWTKGRNSKSNLTNGKLPQFSPNSQQMKERGVDESTMSSDDGLINAVNATPLSGNKSIRILKVRVSDSPDKDFVEIDIPREKLTLQGFLEQACHELGLEYPVHIERIRKLPNTRLRRDVEIQRLENYQEIELVLSKQSMPPLATAMPAAPPNITSASSRPMQTQSISTDLV